MSTNIPTNFEDLPLDVLYQVVETNMTLRDILRLCRTSKYFNDRICKESQNIPRDRLERLWKKLYERDFSAIRRPRDSKYREGYMNRAKWYKQNDFDLEKSIGALISSTDLISWSSVFSKVATNGDEKLFVKLLENYDTPVAAQNNVRIRDMLTADTFKQAVEVGNDDIIDMLITKGFPEPQLRDLAEHALMNSESEETILKLLPYETTYVLGDRIDADNWGILSNAAQRGFRHVIDEFESHNGISPSAYYGLFEDTSIGGQLDLMRLFYEQGGKGPAAIDIAITNAINFQQPDIFAYLVDKLGPNQRQKAAFFLSRRSSDEVSKLLKDVSPENRKWIYEEIERLRMPEAISRPPGSSTGVLSPGRRASSVPLSKPAPITVKSPSLVPTQTEKPRCIAQTKSGERCKLPPTKGSSCCHIHKSTCPQ